MGKIQAIRFLMVVLLIVYLSATVTAAQLLLNDSLKKSTKGTRSGGEFADGGWKVTGKNDSIYWHLPHPVSHGAAEFDIKGLDPNECRLELRDKTEIWHMYDFTFNDADNQYSPGYQNDPFKHFFRKINLWDAADPARDANQMEVIWQILPNCEDPNTKTFSWKPKIKYHFREEWGPDGKGNTSLKIFRNRQPVITLLVPGDWKPGGHSVRIAASTRRSDDAGAPIGAVYSNIKVWDLSADTP